MLQHFVYFLIPRKGMFPLSVSPDDNDDVKQFSFFSPGGSIHTQARKYSFVGQGYSDISATYGIAKQGNKGEIIPLMPKEVYVGLMYICLRSS